MTGRARESAELFPEHGHDHAACRRRAFDAARRLLAGRGARLTELRMHVLAMLWDSHRPLGAYAILDGLAAAGRRAKPPSVYRALEFLAEHGLAHRIESLNAFVGCAAPGHGGPGQFLICESCGAAAEISDGDIARVIRRRVRASGFAPERITVEIGGRCPRCSSRDSPAEPT